MCFCVDKNIRIARQTQRVKGFLYKNIKNNLSSERFMQFFRNHKLSLQPDKKSEKLEKRF